MVYSSMKIIFWSSENVFFDKFNSEKIFIADIIQNFARSSHIDASLIFCLDLFLTFLTL